MTVKEYNSRVSAQTAEIMICNSPISIKEYKGQRVLTFKDIDTVHGRPDGTASRNFKNNRSRFIEGEDYYIVKPSDVQTDEIRLSEINNRGTTLLTESGYLMLVKSFTDDLAWDVQRQLVNTYFRAKNIMQSMSDSYNEITALKSELSQIKFLIENQKPSQPNYWLWKKHIVNPAMSNLADALHIEIRESFDLVYDTMSANYGFDRSFAINQFCIKYGVDSTSVIDAVADIPEYQRWFVESIKQISSHAVYSPVSHVGSALRRDNHLDKVSETIQPLIDLYNDKSANGAKTYGKVYAEMMPKKTWKFLMTRYKCTNKKQLLLQHQKYFEKFRDCANDFIDAHTGGGDTI